MDVGVGSEEIIVGSWITGSVAREKNDGVSFTMLVELGRVIAGRMLADDGVRRPTNVVPSMTVVVSRE